MRRKTGGAVATLLVAAVAAAGCDATREAGAMPSRDATSTPSPADRSASPSAPPLSSTELPTLRPRAKPPKTPSDLVPSDRIAGRVTRGGSGPCYGLVTDDDIEYAVYSTAGQSLREGTYVRIRFEPLGTKIDCGPGRPVRALEMTTLK